jgi:predicted thioesterase
VTKVDGRPIEFAVRANEGAKEIDAGSHSRVGRISSAESNFSAKL